MTVNSNLIYGTVAGAVFAITPLAAHAQATVSGNAFNPAISVILDGQYAHYSRDPSQYVMSGFLLDSEAGLAPKGFSLGESELAASANVDDRFYGQVTVALAATDSGTEVNIEEAFLQTTSLPSGFTLKAGRFFSEIGYLNSKHAHAWDFIDQPLAYKAMLGGQYGDDGIQARWVAPTDLLIELGVEAFRGAQFPAAGATHGGIGSWTAYGHVGGDIGTTQSWRAGVSYLNADALGRSSRLLNGDSIEFTGSSHVAIADAVWKWADHGNPKSRNVVVQAEYLRRQEKGTVVDTSIDYATAVFPAPFIAPNFAYSGTQQGFYVQAVYQFIPRWRVGLRYDSLTSDNRPPHLGVATPLNDNAHNPSRVTAMLDFSNSEFSRLRLQAAQDQSGPQSDSQISLQYIMSVGAHGAHQF
jgi:hypothetical protein